QNREAVVVQPTVQKIHEIEQQLADDLEHPEVHDLSFIVWELREAMIKLRACVDFELRLVRFPGLQLKSWHSERSLNAEQLLVRRALDIETPAPNRIHLLGDVVGKRGN